MKCLVCSASFPGSAACPNCQYDHAAADARDPKAIFSAREEFKARTLAYAPGARVTSKDRWKPWLGLLLGVGLFLFWLRACSSVRWF